eukprot:5071386-Pleurochrysis_carterae.AAC.1
MWAWNRSCHRSAPPGDWTGRGSTRPFSSSVLIRWDRQVVVSLGLRRRGGSRPARVLGGPRVRHPWHQSGLWILVG